MTAEPAEPATEEAEVSDILSTSFDSLTIGLGSSPFEERCARDGR